MLGWKKVWFNHDNIWTYIYIWKSSMKKNGGGTSKREEWWLNDEKVCLDFGNWYLMIKHCGLNRKSWMSPAKTIQKGWKHMQAQNICDIQVSDIVGSKDHDERRFRCSRKTRRMIEAVFSPKSGCGRSMFWRPNLPSGNLT
jgi:hypothetical protein